MPKIRKHIDINVPADKVFAAAVDPAQRIKWVTFLKDVAIVSGNGKSTGTKETFTLALGPRPQTETAEWTIYKESKAFTTKATGSIEMESQLTFDSMSDHSTDVSWQIYYTPPMGPIGLVIDILFMNRIFQNQVEDSLEQLKFQLEA